MSVWSSRPCLVTLHSLGYKECHIPLEAAPCHSCAQLTRMTISSAIIRAALLQLQGFKFRVLALPASLWPSLSLALWLSGVHNLAMRSPLGNDDFVGVYCRGDARGKLLQIASLGRRPPAPSGQGEGAAATEVRL